MSYSKSNSQGQSNLLPCISMIIIICIIATAPGLAYVPPWYLAIGPVSGNQLETSGRIQNILELTHT